MEWKQKVDEITDRAHHLPQIMPKDVPELDLYMDQLLTFLDKRLHGVQREDGTPFVTNTMVNNYTKAKLIPTAVHKRYQKQHVLGLSMIGQLKKVLSMQDLGKISTAVQVDDDADAMYRLFLEAQDSAAGHSRELIQQATDRCEAAGLEGNTALAVIAVQLAAEAQCRALLAEQLLDAMELPKTEESRKKSKT